MPVVHQAGNGRGGKVEILLFVERARGSANDVPEHEAGIYLSRFGRYI